MVALLENYSAGANHQRTVLVNIWIFPGRFLFEIFGYFNCGKAYRNTHSHFAQTFLARGYPVVGEQTPKTAST
jgi:hypothetical protein